MCSLRTWNNDLIQSKKRPKIIQRGICHVGIQMRKNALEKEQIAGVYPCLFVMHFPVMTCDMPVSSERGFILVPGESASL